MRPPSSNDPGWPHHRRHGPDGPINGHTGRLELFTLVHVAVLVGVTLAPTLLAIRRLARVG